MQPLEKLEQAYDGPSEIREAREKEGKGGTAERR